MDVKENSCLCSVVNEVPLKKKRENNVLDKAKVSLETRPTRSQLLKKQKLVSKENC